MIKKRYECGWCHEIVGVGGGRRPPEGICTGQPEHSVHVWDPHFSSVRSPIPFEVDRRFPSAATRPAELALSR
jgi:hypothetical protein